ncbi:MAG: hypothetical protein B9S32_04400 [Verrucomicrobia bacterium Tous-C9LFEB]|nr:MAG: hypothetical protein B9S32_04400 [Verrucomicrobia bacterium Tous-C9LFEB]
MARGMNDTQSIIVQLLRKHGSLTRDQIGQKLGLSAMGTSKPLLALSRSGLVTLGHKAQPGPGRPFQLVQLTEDGGYSLGLVVRPHDVQFALVNFQNKVIRFESVPFCFRSEQTDFSRLLQVARKMIKGLPRKALFTAGLSFSGQFEDETEHILVVNDFTSPGQAELFRRQLSDTVGVPITILHDIDAILIAERWCNPDLPPNPNVLMVGERLGVSVMMNGRLFTDKVPWPRWLGRVQVPDSTAKSPGFLPGALVNTASFDSWINDLLNVPPEARPSTPRDPLDVEKLYQLWEQKDPRVQKLVKRGARDLAYVIRNLCLVFPFERIVCHGWVPDVLEFILNEIRAAFIEAEKIHIHQDTSPSPIVSASILGSQGYATGTALGAIDRALEFKMAQRGRKYADLLLKKDELSV